MIKLPLKSIRLRRWPSTDYIDVFPGGTCVLLFGGGTKKGFLYGETADERPLIAAKNPVTVLHATIMTAMGISPKTEFLVEGSPFYVTEDGKGMPVMDVFL